MFHIKWGSSSHMPSLRNESFGNMSQVLTMSSDIYCIAVIEHLDFSNSNIILLHAVEFPIIDINLQLPS